MAGALALAVYPALAWPRLEAVLLMGAAAVLVLAIALLLGETSAVPWAIALLACELVISLYARGVEASFAAAAYGSALLVVAELAYWSLQTTMPSRGEPGVFKRRAFAIAALGVSSHGAGWIAAALVQAPVPGSLALMAAGVGAIVAAIAVVGILVWRSDAGSS